MTLREMLVEANAAWDRTDGPHKELRRLSGLHYFAMGVVDGLIQGDDVRCRTVPPSPEWTAMYDQGLALGQAEAAMIEETGHGL